MKRKDEEKRKEKTTQKPVYKKKQIRNERKRKQLEASQKLPGVHAYAMSHMDAKQ